MSITILPSMAFNRDVTDIAVLDSHGRLCVHGSIRDSSGARDYTHRQMERYDPSTNTWTTLAASAQWVEDHAYMIDSLDRIIYAGGHVLTPTGTEFQGTNQGEIYDPASDTWSSITTMPGTNARMDSAAWRDGNQLRLAGGRAGQLPSQGPSSPSDYGDAMLYTGGPSGTWSVAVTSSVHWPFAGSGSGAGIARQGLIDSMGRLYLFQSNSPTNFNQRYDPATDTYTALPPLPGGLNNAGDGAAVVAPGDVIYLVGGGTTAGGTTSSTSTQAFRFDIGSNTWTTLAAFPFSVFSGWAVWLGTKLYVIAALANWQNPLIRQRLGIYQYDPSLDTWSVSSDTMSVLRSPRVLSDGVGCYLIGGSMDSAPLFSNVVEYWRPDIARRARSYATVIS